MTTTRARLQELGLDALREMAGSIDVEHDGLQKTKLITAIIGAEKFDEKMLPELPPEPEIAAVATTTEEADKTVHWIHKSQQSQGYAEEPRVQTLALLLLAMAQHQLGQTEEASQAFAEASALIEEHLPKLATGELGGGWHDWLIAEILRREAAKLIAGLRERPSPEANTASNVKTD